MNQNQLKEESWVVYDPKTEEYIVSIQHDHKNNTVETEWNKFNTLGNIVSFSTEDEHILIDLFKHCTFITTKKDIKITYTKDDVYKWWVVRRDIEYGVIPIIDFGNAMSVAEFLK